ncbi:hypothetical protein LZ198_09690 [Myxococcus sp. K15C18031901]|uniref:hypothetical protein n=1 Tax=Myxococcus dinghuensis TaxID=2906761 RepID=UPI0020A7AA64|nr:hypothetical protein [Myxococcus dinghuensis]MCP3099139.1 hypothetical protein [Myxococcus dinghuensis]
MTRRRPRAILKLREQSRHALAQGAQAVRLLDFLFARPVTSVRATEEFLGCSYVTASSVIEQLVDAGLLRETTGQKRNRLYRHEPYLALFERQGLETTREEARSG